MKKVFEMKTDCLKVTVTADDKIFLPTEAGKEEIGTYEQTTIQMIPKDQTDKLYKFVLAEHAKAEEQQKAISDQLDKLKEVDENLSDEFVTVTTDSIKIIVDKKNFMKVQEVAEGAEPVEEFDKEAHEAAMTEIALLNKFIGDVQRKKALIQQLEFIDKQIDQGSKELKDLEEAIK